MSGNGDGLGGGPHVHVGDQVTINGGSHNVGIQHNNGPVGEALPPEVAALFARLAAVVAELADDDRLREADRRRLASALPVLSSPATEERSRWQDTLYLLAGLAQSIGEAAAPALGLANQLLALISG